MKINQLKAGAALSYVSMGLGYVIAIIYTPIMLRLLGQSEYGLYNLVASVVAYLGLLNFGFGSAYIRFYSRYKVNNDRVNIAKLNGMFLIVFSVIGFIAVLAGMVLVFYTETIFGNELTLREITTAKILMAIMVINIAFSFPNIVFNSHITANEQFIFQKILQMVRVVANPFLVLPVLFMGYGSIGMVIVTTVLNISIEVTNALFCFKKLNMEFSFKRFDFSLMKEMTIFSSFIFINMITDQINWNIDKFILGRFHGTIPVAVYGLAAQLNTYYISLSTAVSNVFIPRVHKMVASSDYNQELTLLFTRVGRVQFIILSMVATGLVFFGQPFINMWAGKNYNGSYPIVLLLALPVTIPLIQNIGIEIQRAKNMHKFRSWVYFFIALTNICITIPLARSYGGVGAAMGTALSLIIGNGFIMNWYYHARIGLDMKFFWVQILKFIPSLLLPVLVGILMLSYIDLYKIQTFILSGIVYVIVFSVSVWFLGMNQYEKDLVGKPMNRILKKMKAKLPY
jgi:O-antigen/teichoic acid export membrane protein